MIDYSKLYIIATDEDVATFQHPTTDNKIISVITMTVYAIYEGKLIDLGYLDMIIKTPMDDVYVE